MYPPSRVGAWLATHQFMRHMQGRGHEVAVVANLQPNRSDAVDGIQLHPRHRLRTLVDWADVVVSHAGDGSKVHDLARRRRRPSVRLYHGGDAHNARLNQADLVIANSHASAAALGTTAPTVVCHPPVDPAEVRAEPGDMVTLVNLSKAKGVMTMWRCAELLPEVSFLGVRGGYGQQHTPRARNVETIDTTSNMRDDVFARTRVLLMPSERETWGMVGVEAMCSGIPVIAHPTPGLRESLGDAGVFVDRDDIDGWVREITRLQDPDEWAAASTRALERVAQLDHRADLDRFADAVESLVKVAA